MDDICIYRYGTMNRAKATKTRPDSPLITGDGWMGGVGAGKTSTSQPALPRSLLLHRPVEGVEDVEERGTTVGGGVNVLVGNTVSI